MTARTTIELFFAISSADVITTAKTVVSIAAGISIDGSPIPAEDGSNNFRRDKDGNVIVTRLNEQMCQEIAKAGNGMYIRVDNTNSAEKVLNNEIAKLSKADVESQVYTEFDEQFQALAWLVLILLVVEMLILERKNPLFKNVRLFK